MTRSTTRRSLLTVGLTVALLTVGASPAIAAAPTGVRLDPLGDNSGTFTRVNAPIYATDPDGWLCHYQQGIETLAGDDCISPADRAALQPGPVATSTAIGERIDTLVCRRGEFVLIQVDDLRGWAPADSVRLNQTDPWYQRNRPYSCNALQWH